MVQNRPLKGLTKASFPHATRCHLCACSPCNNEIPRAQQLFGLLSRARATSTTWLYFTADLFTIPQASSQASHHLQLPSPTCITGYHNSSNCVFFPHVEACKLACFSQLVTLPAAWLMSLLNQQLHLQPPCSITQPHVRTLKPTIYLSRSQFVTANNALSLAHNNHVKELTLNPIKGHEKKS